MQCATLFNNSWPLAILLSTCWPRSLSTRSGKRYGRAAVVIGDPFRLAPWIAAQDSETGGLFTIDRAERLTRVQALSDSVLERIAALIPVTAVSLACAAVQSFDGDFIAHDALVARMSEMREVLRELNARVIGRTEWLDRKRFGVHGRP